MEAGAAGYVGPVRSAVSIGSRKEAAANSRMDRTRVEAPTKEKPVAWVWMREIQGTLLEGTEVQKPGQAWRVCIQWAVGWLN